MAPRKKAQITPTPKIIPPTDGGSGVDIDSGTTFFEAIASSQSEEVEEKSMLPVVESESFGMVSEPVVKPVKPIPVAGRANKVEIVPTESLKPLEDLNSTGMAQYVVNAHYILDTLTNRKYLQNTIITLPDDETKLPKLFQACLKTGRISKYVDLQQQVSQNVVAYDPRKRKYVTYGTSEYDEYLAYINKERIRISQATDAKLKEQRQKLGFKE